MVTKNCNEPILGDMQYALEKLSIAIDKLAIGEGDIKSRWRETFSIIVPISEEDFPEDLQALWLSIMHRLTKNESKYKGTEYDEGNFEATIHTMHRKTLSKVTGDLLELYDMLNNYVEEQNEN